METIEFGTKSLKDIIEEQVAPIEDVVSKDDGEKPIVEDEGEGGGEEDVEIEGDSPVVKDDAEDPSYINTLKEYGIDVNNKEELTSKLSDFKKAKDEYDVLVAKIEEKELKQKEIEEKLEALLSHQDPNKVFANDNIKLLNDILRQYPDKDAKSIAKLVESGDGLDSMDSASILALRDLINDPTLGSESELVDYYKDRFDDERALRIEASRAKRELKEIISGVNRSEGLDLEKLTNDFRSNKQRAIEESLESWQPIKAELLKKNEIVATGFSYKVDDESMKEVSSVIDGLINMGIKPDKDNVNKVEELTKATYLYKNFDNVLAKHRANVEAELTEKFNSEVHNSKPLNKQQRQTPNKAARRDDDANNQLLNEF